MSAVPNGHLYHPGDIPDIRICQRPSRPKGESEAGRIKSMTLLGIEPTTFRHVVQCLRKILHGVPLLITIIK